MAANARRPLRESFFDELKAWSEIKLRILTKYLDAYLRVRGGSNPRIYYVDGFAGTGYYGEGEQTEEGSPVQLARMAQVIAAADKPFQLKCINVELDTENHAKLLRALQPFHSELVEVRQGAFADHLDSILQTTQGCPAVFFLDPFGPKPITVDRIRPVLRRPDTELLINLNTPRLMKMAGFEDSTARDRAAKLRLVSETLGDDPKDPNPRWLQEWYRIGDPVKWQEWAADAYMTRLLQESSQLAFALNYAVKESVRSSPKYHLVFLTRSVKAVLIMNDLLCIEEDNLFERTEAVHKGQRTLWGLVKPDDDARRLAELAEEVHAHGMAHQGVCREELIRHFVMARFGEFKQAHYRRAVQLLLDHSRAQRAHQMGLGIDRDPLTFV